MEFEQIYNTYFKAVYRYIWQLSGNEHIAEEITGETFFKAMKSINNFRGECDMRVWLCQIAKNTYFSYLKKNGKIESIDEAKFQNIANPNDFIDEQVNTQEEAAQLRKILHSISEPYDTPGVSHCGIYVGDGKMLHCGDPIGYANLNTSYWQSHFYAYGRLP